jgi:hypothetical protein
MNFNEMIALDAAAVSGLVCLEAKTTQMKLNFNLSLSIRAA